MRKFRRLLQKKKWSIVGLIVVLAMIISGWGMYLRENVKNQYYTGIERRYNQIVSTYHNCTIHRLALLEQILAMQKQVAQIQLERNYFEEKWGESWQYIAELWQVVDSLQDQRIRVSFKAEWGATKIEAFTITGGKYAEPQAYVKWYREPLIMNIEAIEGKDNLFIERVWVNDPKLDIAMIKCKVKRLHTVDTEGFVIHPVIGVAYNTVEGNVAWGNQKRYYAMLGLSVKNGQLGVFIGKNWLSGLYAQWRF